MREGENRRGNLMNLIAGFSVLIGFLMFAYISIFAYPKFMEDLLSGMDQVMSTLTQTVPNLRPTAIDEAKLFNRLEELRGELTDTKLSVVETRTYFFRIANLFLMKDIAFSLILIGVLLAMYSKMRELELIISPQKGEISGRDEDERSESQ